MNLLSSPARISVLILTAMAFAACNPLPKTPDEEEAEQNKAQAKAQARPKATATPRKPGDWKFDNQKDRLNTNDKDNKGHAVNPLDKAAGTPRKDDRYVNPLDKKTVK